MNRDDQIALAEQHVRQAKDIVTRQRERILHLDSVGADSLSAKQTLDLFETNLRIFEGHRDYLKHDRDRNK